MKLTNSIFSKNNKNNNLLKIKIRPKITPTPNEFANGLKVWSLNARNVVNAAKRDQKIAKIMTFYSIF